MAFRVLQVGVGKRAWENTVIVKLHITRGSRLGDVNNSIWEIVHYSESLETPSRD